MKNKTMVILLGRTPNLWLRTLYKFLNKKDIETIIVQDHKTKNSFIHYRDQEIIDAKMHLFDAQNVFRKTPTAWDKAIYHIYKNKLFNYDYYYFIEDDVYCNNLLMFSNLIKETENFNHDLISYSIRSKEESDKMGIFNNYIGWKKYIPDKNYHKEELWFSFNAICRVSRELVKKVFKFYHNNNTLYFHEVMLPVISKRYGLKCMSFKKEKKLKHYFSTFLGPRGGKQIYMEDLSKICHPYKIGEWSEKKFILDKHSK